MHIPALTCRSYYSFLRGPVSVQRLLTKAKEYGYDTVALADVNSMHGVVDFCRTAGRLGIRPIIGAEILTKTKNLTLLAEDSNGYKNLCRIITAGNLDAHFDVTEQLQRNGKGIICICNRPALFKQLKSVVDKGHLFAGCKDAPEIERAKRYEVQPVSYTNFNILDDEDVITGRLLSKIRSLSGSAEALDDDCGFNRMVPESRFRDGFGAGSEAVLNAEKITHRCKLNVLNGKYLLPRVKLGKGKSADRELARLGHIGLAEKYRPVSAEAVKRLEYELAVIRKNKFSDYFLVVRDIINFAKREGIAVEVRGSAAGSLVSYVLGFTRVCPIENRLYFERFMNPGRKDCPDIDIDLCWRRRDEVIRFCYENWGFDNVAMVSNINRYRYRSAFRDTARAFGLAPVQIEQLLQQGNTVTASKIARFAERLTDLPRHLGVHCGGLVITPVPVSDVAPLEMAHKGIVVTQYDKDAAEAVGLIKIDLLGNRALSTVDEAVKMVNKQAEIINIDTIDAADEKTADLLSRGDSLGVFQCESPGMRQLLRALKAGNKKDTAIALSLIRPGPASGGMKAEFIERCVNRRPFEYLHPKLRDITGDTYGVMLYQEDVMRIAVELAGYSVAEADNFRSEVSKNVSASRLQKQYEDFVYGRADKAGIERQTAEAVWEQILKFAAYSYCKAHAAVYANIAWQTAFLKAHYPQQFYTSLFNNHQGMYPLRVYVWEAIRRGIRVLPPDVNKSRQEWSIEEKGIRAGFNIIKGMRRKTIAAIIEHRRTRPFTDIDDFRSRARLSRPELHNLVHVGAFDGFGLSRPATLMRLDFGPVAPNQLLLFDLYSSLSARQLPDYDRIRKLQAEVEVTGIGFSLHPELLVHKRHLLARELNRYVDREVTVAGFIATARQARTNDGRQMGFVTLEDSSGLAEVTFFPDRMEKYQGVCSAAGPVWVTGRVTEHLSSIAVECDNCGLAA